MPVFLTCVCRKMVPLIDELGGAQFAAAYVQQWHRKTPKTQALMMYGATLWTGEIPSNEELRNPVLFAGLTSDKRGGLFPRCLFCAIV
jgi:hypothetical protein